MKGSTQLFDFFFVFFYNSTYRNTYNGKINSLIVNSNNINKIISKNILIVLNIINYKTVFTQNRFSYAMMIYD